MDSNTSSGDGPSDHSVERTQQQQPSSAEPQTTEATDQATNDDTSPTANTVAPEQDQQLPSQDAPVDDSTPENPSPSSEPPAETPEVEHAYWAEIEEDTSEPNESEMKEIEAAADKDYSAYDCKLEGPRILVKILILDR